MVCNVCKSSDCPSNQYCSTAVNALCCENNNLGAAANLSTKHASLPRLGNNAKAAKRPPKN